MQGFENQHFLFFSDTVLKSCLQGWKKKKVKKKDVCTSPLEQSVEMADLPKSNLCHCCSFRQCFYWSKSLLPRRSSFSQLCVKIHKEYTEC